MSARSSRELAKAGEIDLTIVNRTNYFLFTPLLHEVATGSLSPRSVAEPLREIFVHTGTRIIQGIVDSIDMEKQTVKIAANSGNAPLSPSNTIIWSSPPAPRRIITAFPEPIDWHCR